MHLNDRVSRLSRQAAMIAAAVPAALLVAGLATGVASAAPGDDITAECLEFSQGGPWVAMADFDPEFETLAPVPGQEEKHWVFDTRNICDVPATLTIYSENWAVTVEPTVANPNPAPATATVRGGIGGQNGDQVVIGPDTDAPTRINLQQKVLPKNVATPIEYLLGLPSDETQMGFKIQPGWNFELIEDAAPMPAPGAPTDMTISATETEAGTPVRVSGIAEPGSAVTVTGGGATCTTAADATTGAFSCELTISTPGDHSITATAKNAGGTGAASTAVTVKVTAPGDEGTGSMGSSTGSLGSLDFFGSLGG